jgi:hypothetical protein
VPAKDRRNAWTLGGIAIDQVSKYKYLGVVYQEDGSWQAHAQRRLQRCKQPMGTGGHCHAAVPTKVRLLMVQTFIYSAVMYGAEVWDTTKAVKDKMSAVVKKALRSILALHPETALPTFWGGWATSTRCTDAAKLCWQHRCQNMEAGRWPERRCDSHSRVAVVSAGLRWARTGAVMSNPLLSRSSTPNIAKVTAQAKGQPALRR